MEYARSSDGSNGKSTKREPHLTRAETKVETSASLRRRNASSVSRKDVPADGVCNAFVPARTETASASSESSERYLIVCLLGTYDRPRCSWWRYRDTLNRLVTRPRN